MAFLFAPPSKNKYSGNDKIYPHHHSYPYEAGEKKVAHVFHALVVGVCLPDLRSRDLSWNICKGNKNIGTVVESQQVPQDK